MANYDMGQAALIHLIRESYKLFDVAAIAALRAVGTGIATDSKLPLEELEGEVEEASPSRSAHQRAKPSRTQACGSNSARSSVTFRSTQANA